LRAVLGGVSGVMAGSVDWRWRIWRSVSGRGDCGWDVPGVRDDDVVEGSVLLAEAGEAYP